MRKVCNCNYLLANNNRSRKSFVKPYRLIIVFIILALLCALGSLLGANGATLDETIKQELLNIDFSALDGLLENLDHEVFTETSFFDLITHVINGETVIDYASFTRFFLSVFLEKFYRLIPSLAVVAAIAVFTALIDALGVFPKGDGITGIIYTICFCAVATVILGYAVDLVSSTENAIYSLKNMIEIMSPVIVSLMVAGGGNVSASVYQPTMVFLCDAVANLYVCILLPAVILMIVFSVLSNFNPKIKLKKFNEFFQGVCKWIIGMVSALFGIFATVQGLTASAVDGMSLKVLKYTVTSSLPIVGSLVGGSVDFILAGAVMIKCGMGFAGIIIVLCIILTPLLAVFSMQLFLKLLSAFLEPFADNCLIGFLGDLDKSLGYLNAILITFGLMLFAVFVLIIISANFIA